MKLRRYLLINIFVIILVLIAANLAFAYDMGYPFRNDSGNISYQSKTQNFGMFRKYSGGGEEFHTGIDIQSYPLTHEVCAIADGTVLFAGWPDTGELRSYGRVVILNHVTWRSIYNHLASIEVVTGEYVNEGSVIGRQGGSGIVSGKKSEKAFSPHLHLTLGSIPNSGNDLIKKNLENPVKVGLKQSCGKIKIFKPYFIKPGQDNNGDFKFGTKDDKAILINKDDNYEIDWAYDMPIRIIAEAYEIASGLRTNPYKIQYKVYKKGYSTNDLVFNESITFDSLNFPDANGNEISDVGDVYSFIPLAFTKSSFYSYYFKNGEKKEEKFYFYKDWVPSDPGDYKDHSKGTIYDKENEKIINKIEDALR